MINTLCIISNVRTRLTSSRTNIRSWRTLIKNYSRNISMKLFSNRLSCFWNQYDSKASSRGLLKEYFCEIFRKNGPVVSRETICIVFISFASLTRILQGSKGWKRNVLEDAYYYVSSQLGQWLQRMLSLIIVYNL